MPHTPGPWRACKQGECSCTTVWSIATDCPVVTAHHGTAQFVVGLANTDWGDGPGEMRYGSLPLDQAMANAKLIAAAPDLLHALDELLSASERGAVVDGHAAIGLAKAALAKARGEVSI